MEAHLEASTEVKRSRTKLVIETRLPPIEQEGTLSARSQNEADLGDGEPEADDDEFGENRPSADDTKWQPSDARCTRVLLSSGIQDRQDRVLPRIRNGYTKSAPRIGRKCPDDSEICVRGSGRHLLSAGYASIDQRQSRDPPRAPVYRIMAAGSSRVIRSAHAQGGKPQRASTSVPSESRIWPSAPLKQTYFILQKPGVKVQYSRAPTKRKESTRVNPERTPLNAPSGGTSQEIDLLTISFRDSDSPVFGSKRGYSCSRSANRHVLLGTDGKLRLRSASIPTNASIGHCVTGTSKMLHSRSEDRIT